jgi:hypothetical protein
MTLTQETIQQELTIKLMEHLAPYYTGHTQANFALHNDVFDKVQLPVFGLIRPIFMDCQTVIKNYEFTRKGL